MIPIEELQVLIQIGSSIYHISRDLTSAIAKMHRNAYYSKTAGKVSMKELMDKAGSKLTYLEIDTQSKTALDRVSAAMDRYNVLWSQLDDLNLADGKIQIAVNGNQASAVQTAVNSLSAEKLDKLQKLKEKYGTGTDQFNKYKAQLDKEYPAIRNISAEDYLLTRFDPNGNETTEYKEVERRSTEEMQKLGAEAKDKSEISVSEYAAHTSNFEERASQYASARQRLELEELLKQGKASRINITDFKEELVPIAGKQVSFYHVALDTENSVVISKASLINKSTAVFVNDKSYHVLNTASGKITRLSGNKVAELLAKQAAKRAAKVAKLATKTAVKAASRNNPWTTAAEIAVETATKGVKAISNVSTSVRKKK